MSNEKSNSQFALMTSIDKAIGELRNADPLELPAPDAPVVGLCVQQIQGKYHVGNAKRDTDHAIDLLYIAYNTTPQEEGGIRVQISKVMGQLIEAQHHSMRIMEDASRAALEMKRQLADDNFGDWKDIRHPILGGSPTEREITQVITFVKEDLIKLAQRIQIKATSIQERLMDVAKSYDSIIQETEQVTGQSEKSLGKRMIDAETLRRQINENNAQRERLEGLVSELRDEVSKFDRMAKNFEARANSAEERAFVSSIISAATQVISSIVPPLALLGTVSNMVGAASHGSSSGDSSSVTASSSSEDKIGKQKELNDQKAALDDEKKQADAVKKDIQELENAQKNADSPADKEELEKRIATRRNDLAVKENKIGQLAGVVSSLQSEIDKISKALDRMSEQQGNQAASLREMQMKMLEKSEEYEKERRNQAAELTRIKALLQGQRTEEETLQLAVQSLNLSISALKRMQEIVQEMAFFFQSFADFMGQVASDAQAQLNNFNEASSRPTLRANYLQSLVRNTDVFFLKQTAEWYAVGQVSDIFSRCFSEGTSRLTSLKGVYITGPELKNYMTSAGARLTEIAQEREMRSDERMSSLRSLKDQLQSQTVV